MTIISGNKYVYIKKNQKKIKKNGWFIKHYEMKVTGGYRILEFSLPIGVFHWSFWIAP